MIEIPQRYLQVVDGLVAGEDAPGQELLALRDDAAYVAMNDGTIAIVINPSKRGAALEAVIREQLDLDRHSHFKLVIVGGGPDMREVLGRVQPGPLRLRMVQVYHLAADGTVWSGKKSSLDSPIGRVLDTVARGEGREASFAELARRLPVLTDAQREAGMQHVTFVQRFRRRSPKLTLALLVFVSLVFGLELLWGGAEFVPTLTRMGANTEAGLGAEPWRLLAAVCLHGGLQHFVLNAVVLVLLCGAVERIFGWARMAILFVAAGLAGGVASAIGVTAVSVGSSGAISGVFGALFVLAWRPGNLLPPAIVTRLRRAVMISLVLSVGTSLLPQVDWMAHLGGALAGAALVLSGVLTRGLAPLDKQAAAAPTDRPVVRVGALASLALLVGCLGVAVVVGRPWELVRPPTTFDMEYRGIAIELPVQRSELVDYGEKDGMFAMRAGNWLKDPVEVYLDIKPRDEGGGAPNKDSCFLVENPLQDFSKDGEGMVASAPVWTYEERYSSEELQWIRRCSYFPSALVNTTVTAWTGAEPAWVELADRMLDSVREVPR